MEEAARSMGLFSGRGDLICVPPARPKVNSGVAGFMFQRRGNQFCLWKGGTSTPVEHLKFASTGEKDSDVVPDVVSKIRFKGISNIESCSRPRPDLSGQFYLWMSGREVFDNNTFQERQEHLAIWR
jgi:hypothetical protein